MKNMIKSLKTRLTMPKRGIPETTRSEEKGILKSFGSELDTSNITKVSMSSVKGLEDSGKGFDLDSIMNGIEEYLNDAEATGTEQEKSNQEEDGDLEASGNSKKPEAISLTKEDETPALDVSVNAKKPEVGTLTRENKTPELDVNANAEKPETSTSTKENETAESNVGAKTEKEETSVSTKKDETAELDLSSEAEKPETSGSTKEHKSPESDSSGNSKKRDDFDANAKKTDTDTNESKTAAIDSSVNSNNTEGNVDSKPADVEVSDSAKEKIPAESDVNDTTKKAETATSESKAVESDVTSNTKEAEVNAKTPGSSNNANKIEDVIGDETPPLDLSASPKKTQDVVEVKPTKSDVDTSPIKPAGPDVSANLNKTEITTSKNEAEVVSPTSTNELLSEEIKNKAQLDENQQRADSQTEPESDQVEAQQQPSILDLDTEEILRQLETLDDTAISQLAAEIEEPDIRDAPIYIYTSLAGGGFHMVPRTNRLATILTANRIDFQYRDLGTDAAARATWKALAAGKQLPGVVQGDQRLIGDWQEIDDLNESARLRDSVLAV